MKKRHIIAALAVYLLFAAFPASAATPDFRVEYSQEKGNYVVSGNVSEAHSRVMLVVEKSGVAYIDGLNNVTGAYEFEIKPENYITKGDYTVTVNVNGNQSVQGQLIEAFDDFKIHSYEIGENGLSATATVKNLSAAEKAAPRLIIAAYDKVTGALLEAKIKESETIDADTIKTYSIALTETTNAQDCVIKAFMWSDFSGMQPLVSTVD